MRLAPFTHFWAIEVNSMPPEEIISEASKYKRLASNKGK